MYIYIIVVLCNEFTTILARAYEKESAKMLHLLTYV